MYSTEDRVKLVGALGVVDEVIIYRDVYDCVMEVSFDTFAIGGDQGHDGFKRAMTWCEENGKRVVRLARTEEISSFEIKRHIREGA